MSQDLIDQLDAAFAGVNDLLFHGHLPSAVPVLGPSSWFELDKNRRRIVLGEQYGNDPPILMTCLISACVWWAAVSSFHDDQIDVRVTAAWQHEAERIRRVTGWPPPAEGDVAYRWPAQLGPGENWLPPDLSVLQMLARSANDAWSCARERRAA